MTLADVEVFLNSKQKLQPYCQCNKWFSFDHDAKNTLEDFRQKNKLDQIWPPPITHIINFIHHMQSANYSALQSDLNFSNKMHEHVDYIQSFAVQKFFFLPHWSVFDEFIATLIMFCK
jgi:hypothetical protein